MACGAPLRAAAVAPRTLTVAHRNPRALLFGNPMPQAFTLGLPRQHRQLIISAMLVAGGLLLAGITLLVAFWPFSRAAVVKALEETSLSKVDVGSFHATYFPRPGCLLQHVVFRHNLKAGAPPLLTVESIRIESSFIGLFNQHVKRVRAEGLHILIPPRETDEHFETPQRSSFVIEELTANGAVLEVLRSDRNDPPLKFTFRGFSLSDVGGKGPASFKADFSNPEPPGEITTTGQFGPWNADEVGKTKVGGDYTFRHADLGMFHGISGLLSSAGKFAGVLEHLDVQGETETPDFAVTSGSNQVPLRTQFHAVVNGENGDTFLQEVAATLGKTSISSEGSIATHPGTSGKTASLQFTTRDGRIQDLLLLFATSRRAPMSGNVSFKAQVSIPAEQRRFLEKVELQGDFGIEGGSFTKPDTQHEVNDISAGARGEKKPREAEKKDEVEPETVLSNLRGHVLLKNGTARFANLSFGVPGATALLHGTYNVISEKIDLHGTLKTDEEPSGTTHGFKTAMLKVLEPFFKKKHAGYAMPVKITGTYEHPIFGLDLGDAGEKKSEKRTSPQKHG
jgi:AsmA-like C-terminal region